jgi:stage II sporulation protein AB (anti-sigma F factor)
MGHNRIKIEFLSKSQNEGFARVAVAAFAAQLDPTIEEISDVKTAVSEAVTNAIIHGYDSEEDMIAIEAIINENELTVIIQDTGKGIDDLEIAMQPLYTSRPDLERSGMGFTVMETFMDSLEVKSDKGRGTSIIMKKIFNPLS